MAKLKKHPRIEALLKGYKTAMDSLAGDASKISKGYYTFQSDHNKGTPWNLRSRLSLRVSYVDQKLRISWRSVKWFRNRQGKAVRTVRHISRGKFATKYEDYLLRTYGLTERDPDGPACGTPDAAYPYPGTPVKRTAKGHLCLWPRLLQIQRNQQ